MRLHTNVILFGLTLSVLGGCSWQSETPQQQAKPTNITMAPAPSELPPLNEDPLIPKEREGHLHREPLPQKKQVHDASPQQQQAEAIEKIQQAISSQKVVQGQTDLRIEESVNSLSRQIIDQNAHSLNAGQAKSAKTDLKKLAENWARLPAKEQGKALAQLTPTLSAAQRQLIEDYMRRLAQGQKAGEAKAGEALGEEANGEDYNPIVDNPFRPTLAAPLSTFSIDVDTASYSNVRRYLQQKELPPRDAVRIEELINYFDYSYAMPKDEHPIAIHAAVGMCPWNAEHQLVRIGLQASSIDTMHPPARNFVFLIDRSGSMDNDNRLLLFKEALKLLVKQLTAKDRVSIVAYADIADVVLPATAGDRHDVILAGIAKLQAGGSTNGAEGIQMAYRLAEENFIKAGVNRVILGTDGDFNVGVTNQGDLVRLIEDRRKTGVYLSILGFGMGNLKDATMEKLAHHGNGHYAYVDSLDEAKQVFVTNGGVLTTVANDVKLQIEFNPAWVQAYRLIGYANRLLRDEDFNDDTKDAGDIGAGQTVTALYEIVPTGVKFDLPKVDGLKYQNADLAKAANSSELLTVKLRYIPPGETKSRLLQTPLENRKFEFAKMPDDFRFATAVAAFGMLLRDSQHCGKMTLSDVADWARSSRGQDMDGRRGEFAGLVETGVRLRNNGGS